ncbi:hypothetical protein [Occallatibacter savannae]|uniref:hypothetical protein n=1 Tax=Occallatibacter savannae TaxID=1002691 RepID=UPI000D69706B|nr:hypothetical protein [Occallatibacter savannae]
MGAGTVSSSLLVQELDRARSDLSAFNLDWWLEIARSFPGYREATFIRGKETLGRLPYVLRKNRIGLTFGHDPYWAHLGGPIVQERLSISEQADAIRSLVQQLPKRASLTFVCDPTVSYAGLVRSAFIQAGFEYTSQLTYVRLPEDGDVLSEKSRKHRGHIKRAAKSLDCIDVSACEFVQFFKENLDARGKQSYAPLDMLPQLIGRAVERGCARAIAAVAKSQSPQGPRPTLDAAIVYIWDDRRCYYWLSTHRVAGAGSKPHPDAVKLLLVNAMEHAQSMGLVFDADGVVTPGADHLYRTILGFRIEERRDVFVRLNALERMYQKSRLKLMRGRSDAG